mgnify:FL=1
MKVRSVTPMWIAKIGYIVMSAVIFSLGILFIALPDISMQTIVKALGTTMIFFGCVKLIGYFSKDLFRLAFQYDLQFGVLVFVLGFVILFKTCNAINLLFTVIGISVLADSLFKLQIAFDSRRFGIKKWWGILALGILTGIIALVLVFMPFKNIKALSILLGVTLITEGILNLFVAITTVKIVKHQYPDFIDVDFFEKEDEN